jgi:hypothetical protein
MNALLYVISRARDGRLEAHLRNTASADLFVPSLCGCVQLCLLAEPRHDSSPLLGLTSIHKLDERFGEKQTRVLHGRALTRTPISFAQPGRRGTAISSGPTFAP